MTKSERDLLRDVRRLMGIFLFVVVVLAVVATAGLEWAQHQRAKDQRVLDRQLDQRLVLGCRAINTNRAAGNRNANVLVGFLRQAEKARRGAAAHETGVARTRDLRAADTYRALAESYTVLPLLDCRSAFDVGKRKTGG